VDYTECGRLRLEDLVKFCIDHKIDIQFKGIIKKPTIVDKRRETL
jgi:hypothetical protein